MTTVERLLPLGFLAALGMQRYTKKSDSTGVRRYHPEVWVIAIALIAIIALAAIWSLTVARTRSLHQSSQTAEILAKSVDQTFSSLIDAVDNSLLTSADEITHRQQDGTISAELINAFLLRQTERFPHVVFMRAANENGEVIYGPDIRTPPVNNGNREYFLELKRDPNHGLILTEPLIARTEGFWSWVFVRRVDKPDGAFGGVVLAAIKIDDIRKMLLQVPIAPGNLIALRSSSLGLIARNSGGSAIEVPPGDTKLSDEFREALKVDPNSGTYVSGTTGIDPIRRVHYYYRNPKYGYLLNVGLTVDSVLVDWQQQRRLTIGFLGAITILLMSFAWYMSRSLRRQEDFVEKLQLSRSQFDTLTNFDPLTQLPNRRLLMDRLSRVVESFRVEGKVGALLYIDLDEFKIINDTQGHRHGDLALQEVAKRLVVCVGGQDTVAHLGGDEFVVLLDELSADETDAASRAEKIGDLILAMLCKPFNVEGAELRVTASIGVAILSQSKMTAEALLRQADIAMDQAKLAGKNCLRFFDSTMQEGISKRVELDKALQIAIDERQFRLYYQAQVDDFGRVIGAEALIRWLHPTNGLLLPGAFIPRAEESGAILRIGNWVLDEACRQLKCWESDPVTRDLVISINVSAKQFHQSGFISEVVDAIKRHGINPARIELELTEGLMLSNVERTIGVMNALHRVGVKLSLDDFGTGYSSLQYLKRLPIDQFKIDKSFVHDIAHDSDDRSIVSTIIAMAHTLNLDVIAEGVETQEQQSLLQQEGCHHFQGYLFGKPIPVEEFEASLAHH